MAREIIDKKDLGITLECESGCQLTTPEIFIRKIGLPPGVFSEDKKKEKEALIVYFANALHESLKHKRYGKADGITKKEIDENKETFSKVADGIRGDYEYERP